jgi:hypothetical protein
MRGSIELVVLVISVCSSPSVAQRSSQGAKKKHHMQRLCSGAAGGDQLMQPMSLGLEPYSGRILGLKIWWTNQNPKLVTSYYLDGCRKAGGMFLIFSIT